MHRALAFSAAVLALMATAPPVWAAELIMFRRAGCPYCLTWDRVIGPVYPKSDIGRHLPLRFFDLDRDGQPETKLLRPVRFTPTFVLVEEGREVGRIEGYPGEEFFWGLLERLVRTQPPSAETPPRRGLVADPRRDTLVEKVGR